MILATLLLIGKEALITTLFNSGIPTMCDQFLPFHADIASEVRTIQGDPEDDDQSLPRTPTQRQSPVTSLGLFDHLSPLEISLFSYWQLQVISPFLIPLGLGKESVEEPDGTSLPWQDLIRARELAEGEVSYVQKLKIFSGNHSLVSRLQGSLHSHCHPTRLTPLSVTG